MKKVFLIMLFLQFLHAKDGFSIDRKIEELDEAKQALESYQAAFLALQKEKEEKNEKILENIKAEQEILKNIRNENAKILAEIRKLKEEILEAKKSKIAEAYSKMKDAQAALILETMQDSDVLEIFASLEPKKISAILAKMTPKKAGELTKLLNNNFPK